MRAKKPRSLPRHAYPTHNKSDAELYDHTAREHEQPKENGQVNRSQGQNKQGFADPFSPLDFGPARLSYNTGSERPAGLSRNPIHVVVPRHPYAFSRLSRLLRFCITDRCGPEATIHTEAGGHGALVLGV